MYRCLKKVIKLISSYFWFTLLSYFVAASSQGQEVELTIVTEDSYPIQYIENNQLKGKNANAVKSMLKKANIQDNIKVMPWARAYQIASTRPNVMIFSIARTPEREHEFIWGASLTNLNYSLYTLKESQLSYQKKPLEQLQKLSVATIRNSATEQYLKSKKFKQLQPVNNPVQMINMLKKKRVDAIPANKTSLAVFCQKMKLDCDDLVEFYPLDLPATQLYFAFSKGTEPALIKRIMDGHRKTLSQEHQ